MEQPEIKEEVGSGIFFQYVNSIVSVLAGFIYYLYIIHFFTSTLVGIVALLTAIISFLSAFFSLGLGSGLSHYISYYLGRREYGRIREFVIKFLLIGLTLGIISLLSLYFTAPIFAMLFFHTYKYIVLVRYLSVDLLFVVLSGFMGSMLIGLQNFKSQAVWSVSGILISYSLAVVLFVVFQNSLFIVVGWFIGSAFSSIAYLLIILKRLKFVNGNDSGIKVKPVFNYTIPLFLASLIGTGSSYVDRFVVSHFLNLSLLGIYNLALLLSSAITFIIAPISTILFPKLSEMYGQGMREEMKKYVAKGIELISAIYVPVAMLVAALSYSVVLLISKEEYLPASLPAMIVLVISSLFISGTVLAVSLQGIRKTRIFIMTSSAALLSNFILSVFLIPRYQMIGASIGYSSVNVVSFFIMYYYARKFDVLKFEGIKLAKIYISGFVMFSIILELQNLFLYSPLKLLAYILLGFGIYSGLIKVMKTFNNQDLDFIMLLIPLWLQRVRGVISALFL